MIDAQRLPSAQHEIEMRRAAFIAGYNRAVWRARGEEPLTGSVDDEWQVYWQRCCTVTVFPDATDCEGSEE